MVNAMMAMLEPLIRQITTLADELDSTCKNDAERLLHAAAVYMRSCGSEQPELERLIPDLGSMLRCEGTTGKAARQRAGAYYTPPMLVGFILDHTLDLWLAENPDCEPTVLDPSCGTGRFLLAAGRRLVRRHISRTGESESAAWRHVGPLLLGLDSDQIATAWLAGRIQSLAGGDHAAATGIQTTDALGEEGIRNCRADIVVGNPPFGSPLKQASDAEAARRAMKALGGRVGPYTDLAAIFLGHARAAVNDGGFLAMVQPLSVLASRDADQVRAALLETCTPTAAWASGKRIFDADVFTCAVVFKKGPSPRECHVSRFRDLPAHACGSATIGTGDRSWSPLATAAMGFPDVPEFQDAGTIGDIAEATADFRDQYYGLKQAIIECGTSLEDGVAPVVTTGVLDSARCYWGDRPIRLFGQLWNRPGIVISSLDTSMQEWATARLVPKLMLPTQTRTLEPVLDLDGRWLPSVPIISITARRLSDLPRIAAVLACPLISLLALHRCLGTARSPKAIKLSASDVLSLPTPADEAAWEAGASAFVLAQQTQDQTERDACLLQCGEHMLTAYRVEHAAIESG